MCTEQVAEDVLWLSVFTCDDVASPCILMKFAGGGSQFRPGTCAILSQHRAGICRALSEDAPAPTRMLLELTSRATDWA